MKCDCGSDKCLSCRWDDGYEAGRTALRARVAALEGLLERWMGAYDDGEMSMALYQDTDEALALRPAAGTEPAKERGGGK